MSTLVRTRIVLGLTHTLRLLVKASNGGLPAKDSFIAAVKFANFITVVNANVWSEQSIAIKVVEAFSRPACPLHRNLCKKSHIFY